MKYFFRIIFFVILTSAYAGGHLSPKDKEAVTNCAGIYYANSMIPQGTLELDKIVHSIAAKKFLTSYLIKEDKKKEKLNQDLLKIVDERYKKPYDKKVSNNCDTYIYKLIPESKAEIDKLVKSGIY